MSQDNENVSLPRRALVSLLAGVGLGTLQSCRDADEEPLGAATLALTGTGVQWADTLAELRGLTGNTTSVAILAGETTRGDGYGGIFYWISESPPSVTHDGGFYVVASSGTPTGYWKRQIDGFLSVRWFGATGDGVTDDTAAIQIAINAALTVRRGVEGNTVYFPPGRYKITQSLTVGGASAPHEGLVLVGPSRNKSNTQAVLTWGGSADTASNTGVPMLAIRNAHGGIVRNLGFDAGRIESSSVIAAAYCVNIAHVSGDANTTQGWVFENCFFTNAARYNVLLGPAGSGYSATSSYGEGGSDPGQSGSDSSHTEFRNCIFMRSRLTVLPATRAHIKVRGSQSLALAMYSSLLDQTVRYGVELEAGQMCFYSVVSDLSDSTGVADIYLNPTPSGSSDAPAVAVYGWESQSKGFLHCGSVGATGQRPTVLSGVYHGAQSGTSNSVFWNFGGWAPLVLTGCRLKRDVYINRQGSIVMANGILFDDITVPGSSPTRRYGFLGYTENLSGQWYQNLRHEAKVGTMRMGPLTSSSTNAPTNQIDAGTVTLAAGATVRIGGGTGSGTYAGALSGILAISASGGSAALLILAGPTIPSSPVAMMSDPYGVYSVNPTATNRFSVFWDDGTIHSATGVGFKLRNNFSSSYTFRLTTIGTGDW